jgi:hypothetical protein
VPSVSWAKAVAANANNKTTTAGHLGIFPKRLMIPLRNEFRSSARLKDDCNLLKNEIAHTLARFLQPLSREIDDESCRAAKLRIIVLSTRLSF